LTSDGATSVRRSTWPAWGAALVVALVAAAIHAARNRGEVLAPLSDESLLLPIALRQAHPSLYAGDSWLATTAGVFSVPYSWIVATLLSFIDDPVVAMRVLSIPAHVVLLAGTWRLVERIADRHAAVVATLLVALPPCSPLVFAPGAALPRDLVFAALPWLVLALLDATRTRGIVVFAALGVLANLHPLTALHFAVLCLGCGLLVDRTMRGLVETTIRGLAFAVGAAPYVVQYLGRPIAVGDVDPTVYAWRLPGMAGESVGAWALRMEPLLWMTLAAEIALIVARRRGFAPPRPVLAGFVVAFVVAAGGPTLGRFVPPLRALQFGRFERIADFFSLVVFASCVAALLRTRAFVAAVAASAVYAASLVQGCAFDDSAPHGPIARLGRLVDRRKGVPPTTPAPEDLLRRADVVDPTSPTNREAFLAVCRFAREKTPEDARFLVPPEQWAPFRVYARRGVVVTRKEGGAALSFLGAKGMDWYRSYASAVATYAHDRLVHRAITYVVADRAMVLTPDWRVALESGPFVVYERVVR